MTSDVKRHHVDTSVLIEPEHTDIGRACRQYLQRVGYKYVGIVSFPVLSELFLITALLDDFNERYDFLEPLLATVRAKRMEFYSPKDIGTLLNSIRDTEGRLRFLDREILACAAESQADALVTLDRTMIRNRNLEKLLNVRIFHPKDLL